MRMVMVDNYDSFTYNLVQLFSEFDVELIVHRNDKITLEGIAGLDPDYICISPGPKDPAHAGISKAVVDFFSASIPTLGVCLGMQVVAETFHGKTVRAPVPVHGKRCLVQHSGAGLFAGLPSPFWAARYHSLCVELGSSDIDVLAVADDGVIMGIQHRSRPLCGVQFHPESFMTEYGLELVRNFLALRPQWKAGRGLPLHDRDRFPRYAPAMVSAQARGFARAQ